jgi:RecJ-like exonuclease
MSDEDTYYPDCQTCIGTGEGMHEGTRCYDCNGRGYSIEIDPLTYEPDDEGSSPDDVGPDRYWNGWEWIRQ